MKTKDLIELLQQADPSGELHVRIDGSMPQSVDKKPGYYDGYYQYKDGNKIIISTEGEKVDIHTLKFEDWIWENFEDWESKIEFKHYNQETIDKLKTHFAEIAAEAEEFDKHSVQEFSKFVLDKIKDGYKIIQQNTEVGTYNSMFFTKPGSKIQLRQRDCHAIIRGSFKPIKKDGYIEWEPNNA